MNPSFSQGSSFGRINNRKHFLGLILIFWRSEGFIFLQKQELDPQYEHIAGKRLHTSSSKSICSLLAMAISQEKEIKRFVFSFSLSPFRIPFRARIAKRCC